MPTGHFFKLSGGYYDGSLDREIVDWGTSEAWISDQSQLTFSFIRIVHSLYKKYGTVLSPDGKTIMEYIDIVPLEIGPQDFKKLLTKLVVRDRSFIESCYIAQYPDTYEKWEVRSIIRYPWFPEHYDWLADLEKTNKADFNLVVGAMPKPGRGWYSAPDPNYSIEQLQRVSEILRQNSFEPSFVLTSGLNTESLLKLRSLLLQIRADDSNQYYSITWKCRINTYEWNGKTYDLQKT